MAKLHASVIVTYRCNARCNMCDVWQHPTRPAEEISTRVLGKLPSLFFCNVTGGEPFIRGDLEEIVAILCGKAQRVVISTNGYFTDRVLALSKRFPDVGIRISLEGLPKTHDAIRGMPGGFDKALTTFLGLMELCRKDIGFAMTVQGQNCRDLIPLYHMASRLGVEFATAALHNSFYFHKLDNHIENKDEVAGELTKLAAVLLGSKRPKEWARGYFNYGLARYVQGAPRMLPCEMGQDGFFVDPWGDVLPCNGMDEKKSMGNLNEKAWEEIWNGEEARRVRESVRSCPKQCWMIGSAAPAIWRHPAAPLKWVLRNKVRTMLGKEVR